MMLERFVVLTATVAAFAFGQNSSVREVSYPSMDPCCQGASFDKGYFVQMKGYDKNFPPDGYSLWAPDGLPVYQIDIVAPDGTPGHLRDVAIDTDGSAIVAMSYGGWGGRGHVKGGGITVISPGGKQTQFIATDRWLPARVGFAPDHSIWVSGTQYQPIRNGDDKDHVAADYQLVRKYSRDGKLLGEFLPRSSFTGGLSPADNGSIRAASDRVGVLTLPVANYPEWVELNLDGKFLGRWKLGPYLTGDPETHRMTYQLGQLAFTADARLFALPEDPVNHKRQIVIFDRATSSWQPTDAAGSPPAQSYLVGADGNDLAFERRIDGVTVIRVTPSR